MSVDQVSTDDILKKRGKTHGEYADHAQFTQHFLRAVMKYKNWGRLSDCQHETLHMIAHKIGRILTGDPDIADHWDDIAGYACLVSRRLGPGGRANSAPEPKPKQSRIDILANSVLYSLDDPPGPGTPEDGGHHARQEEEEPALKDGEDPIQGLHYVTVVDNGDTYWLVDREYYSTAATDHLPKLKHKINHYEWRNLSPWYRGMYSSVSDLGCELKDNWVSRWGT